MDKLDDVLNTEANIEEDESNEPLVPQDETSQDVDEGLKVDSEGEDEDLGDGEDGESKIEWQPNFKFKVLDEEHEIDEWARNFVTQENEGLVRELFEKAYGLPHVKEKYQSEKKSREEISSEYNEFKAGVKELVDLRDTDLGAFFNKAQVPRDQVMQWCLAEIEKENLPEGHKKVYNEVSAMRDEIRELRKQNSDLNSRYTDQSTQARVNELDREMNDTGIAALAEDYDNRMGKSGSFRNLVIRHGQAEFATTGKDLSAKQAIGDVLKMLNLQAQAPGQAAPSNEPGKPNVIKNKKPVVLPDTGNSTASPTTKIPTSLDDLRKLRDQMTSSAG